MVDEVLDILASKSGGQIVDFSLAKVLLEQQC